MRDLGRDWCQSARGAAPNGGPVVVGNPKHPNLDQITLNTYAKLKKLKRKLAEREAVAA